MALHSLLFLLLSLLVVKVIQHEGEKWAKAQKQLQQQTGKP